MNERERGTGTPREIFGPSILTTTSKSHTPNLQQSPDPGRRLHGHPSLRVVVVGADFMEQKWTEGFGMKRGPLDTTITLTRTRITQTLTQKDTGGATLQPRRPEASTSPTPILLRFSPLPLARPTPPRPENLAESNESSRRHMCLLWRYTTSGLGPSRSPRKPVTTNTVTNTGTETEIGTGTGTGTETETESGTETGRGRATGFLKGALSTLDSPSLANQAINEKKALSFVPMVPLVNEDRMLLTPPVNQGSARKPGISLNTRSDWA